MITAYYAGASGLKAYQEDINIIGNNIANANTNGFKPVTLSFDDLLYSEMYVNSPKNPLVGTGVKAGQTGIDTRQGTPVASTNKLDLAIVGNGWFAVESSNGTMYTRDGSFAVSLSGSTAYLVNKDGNFVLDANGKRITATTNQTSTGTSGTTGTSGSTEIDYDATIKQIGIFGFTNPEALTPASSNSYLANDISGKATAATAGANQILSGYLEQSGVSVADEMVNLITAQRAYQISARVVQTSDEIEQTVNSLRG